MARRRPELEGDEGGRDVGQAFVHGQALRAQRGYRSGASPSSTAWPVSWATTSRDRLQVDVAAVGVEHEELEAPGLALVVRVWRPPRAREDEQLRAVEAPRDGPPEDLLPLEQSNRPHGHAECIERQELARRQDVRAVRQVYRYSVAPLAGDEAHRRQRRPGPGSKSMTARRRVTGPSRKERLRDVVVLRQRLERAAFRAILDEDRYAALRQHVRFPFTGSDGHLGISVVGRIWGETRQARPRHPPRRTDGWIAALQLAALAITGGPIRARSSELAGDDRYIVERSLREAVGDLHASMSLSGERLPRSVPG